VKGSKPYGAAGIDRAPRPGFPRLADGGCFPLTPPLSLGERVSPSICGGQSRPVRFLLRDARCSLSLRERVRVRGNDVTSIRCFLFRTGPGIVELVESSGKAGGFPE